MTMISDKFVPVYKYAQDNGIQIQNVYRHIKEGRIPKESYKKIVVTKEKLVIDPDYKIVLRKNVKTKLL